MNIQTGVKMMVRLNKAATVDSRYLRGGTLHVQLSTCSVSVPMSGPGRPLVLCSAPSVSQSQTALSHLRHYAKWTLTQVSRREIETPTQLSNGTGGYKSLDQPAHP